MAEVGVEKNRIKTLLISIKDKFDEFKVKIDKYNSYLKTLEYPSSEDIEDEWEKLEETYDLKNPLWTALIRLE